MTDVSFCQFSEHSIHSYILNQSINQSNAKIIVLPNSDAIAGALYKSVVNKITYKQDLLVVVCNVIAGS